MRLAIAIVLTCAVGAYADDVTAPGATWYANTGPVATSSTPGPAFWDNPSGDGDKCNVGYLLAGTYGTCNFGGSVIQPPGNLRFLASSAGQGTAAPSLTFTPGGSDSGVFEATFTLFNIGIYGDDEFGWTTDNGATLHPLFSASNNQLGDKVRFAPGGPFQFYLRNDSILGDTTFLSGTNGRQFALFSEQPVSPIGPPSTLHTYWIGAEDVRTVVLSAESVESDYDYNDVVVKITSVPNTLDASYQVRYASNLTAGDAVINISNTGAKGNSLFGPGYGVPVGNICVNVYAFSPDEQMISCCSCLVTPNGLVHVTANNDLVSNTLTGIRPDSIVIKLVATATGKEKRHHPTGADTDEPSYSGSSCTNSAAQIGGNFPLADAGLVAWGTTVHSMADNDPPVGPFSVTETPFLPATLSTEGNSELASLTNRCASIIGNGSSFGICRSCRLGGLGGAKQ